MDYQCLIPTKLISYEKLHENYSQGSINHFMLGQHCLHHVQNMPAHSYHEQRGHMRKHLSEKGQQQLETLHALCLSWQQLLTRSSSDDNDELSTAWRLNGGIRMRTCAARPDPDDPPAPLPVRRSRRAPLLSKDTPFCSMCLRSKPLSLLAASCKALAKLHSQICCASLTACPSATSRHTHPDQDIFPLAAQLLVSAATRARRAGQRAPDAGGLRSVDCVRRLAALAQHRHDAAVHRAHKVLRVQDRVQRLHLEHVPPRQVLRAGHPCPGYTLVIPYSAGTARLVRQVLRAGHPRPGHTLLRRHSGAGPPGLARGASMPWSYPTPQARARLVRLVLAAGVEQSSASHPEPVEP